MTAADDRRLWLQGLAQSGATDEQVPGYVNSSGFWVPRDTVHSIVEGDGVSIDNTDPFHPRISATGSGGGGGGGVSYYPPGSADVPPVSPNAKDDEFDGTSPVTWTATPTAAALWAVDTDRVSHLHLQATSAQGSNAVGKVQATPSTPFTITTKLAGHNIRTNFSFAGLLLAPSGTLTSSSLMVYFGPQFNSGSSNLAVRRGSNNLGGTGSFSETVAPVGWQALMPPYLRAVVSSATSVDFLASFDGFAWATIQSGFNPGFTPGVMGLCASYNGGGTVDAYFDFFRVT